MKTFLIILILLALVLPATAQETNYSDHLIQDLSGAYYRAPSLPVRVCGNHDLLPVAIDEMNRAVASIAALDNCDVIVQAANFQACPDDAEGCAIWDVITFYPVRVHVQTYSNLPTLLHELEHAFGVWGHPENEQSALSQPRDSLSAFDVAILQFLYSQPAKSRDEMTALAAPDTQADERYFETQCAWIAAHSVDEKYRCE